MSVIAGLDRVYTGDVGRDVYLRPGTKDRQVWADTFTGRYHLPPDSMLTPRTVLDLGASIGLTAAHYRALWPDADVLAVEMDLGSADLCLRNAPGARLVVCAVANYSGTSVYEGSAASDAYALGGDPASPHAVVVPCRTLSEVIVRGFGDLFEVGVVDFVKMDVEGTEWSLFANPEWAPLVRHLLVELHQEPGYPVGGADVSAVSDLLVRRAIESLEAAGFHAERHERHPRAVWAWR